MQSNKFLGIDPGSSGAIAIITDHEIDYIKLSETPHDVAEWLDTKTLNDLHWRERSHDECFAVIEKVSAMPKQGVSSTFKFGRSFGFLEGLLTAFAIPYEYALPRQWQKEMGCLSGGDKNVTKAKAQQLFPSIKATHAISDALLLAEYARRKQSLK